MLTIYDPKSIVFGRGAIMFDDGRKLYFDPLHFERVQRGWELIYSKYCTGKAKPF